MPDSAYSADSHLNEPLSLYERLPHDFRHRAPHIEERNGKRFFVAEGQAPRPLEAPNPLREDDKQRYWRSDHGDDIGRTFDREGGIDVQLRLRDQEMDG